MIFLLTHKGLVFKILSPPYLGKINPNMGKVHIVRVHEF